MSVHTDREIEVLKEAAYSARLDRRRQVAECLIRAGYNGDTFKEQAEMICAFIEGDAPKKAFTKKRGRPSLGARLIKSAKGARKTIASGKKKGKRKYTKKSAFWSKEK